MIEKSIFGLSSEILTVKDLGNQIDENGLILGLLNPFNGTFFSADLVRNIGYVKSEMFIWGDEAEYIKRAKKNNMVVATLSDARVYHPKSKTVYEPFFFNLYRMENKPSSLRMNYFRNKAYLASKYQDGVLKHKFFLKGVLYFLSKMELYNLNMFVRYYIDGALDVYKLPPLYLDD